VSRARTLLVAVDGVFLDAVCEWVADDERIEVVEIAHSGSAALERVESLGVELVLVDVTLPDMSGFEVVRRLKSRPDAPLAVLLSFYDSRAAQLEAWAAGADGFLPKSDMAEGLMPLVGDLLRRRNVGIRERGSVTTSMRVPPTDVS
jgi:two-component system, OmpR family, response regulator CpxR